MPEKFFEQHFDQYEIRENLEWYTRRVVKSLEIFHDEPMYKTRRENLLELTNGRKVSTFEKLIERTSKKGPNLSFQFKDTHRGYILETGGVAFLHPEDEAILPHMRHCYLISAELRYQDQNVLAVMHHGPAWAQLPFFIDALSEHGEVGEISCACNNTFNKGSKTAEEVAHALSEALQKNVKPIDLSFEERVVHVLVQNRQVKLLMADIKPDMRQNYRDLTMKEVVVKEQLK